MKSQTNDQDIELFLHYVSGEKNYSSHTLENYHRSLRQFTDYLQASDQGERSLRDITQEEIKGFLAYLKAVRSLKRVSQLNRIAALRSFFRFLRRRKLIEHNPCDGLGSLKAEKKLPTFLSLQEIDAFLEALRTKEEQYQDVINIRNRALFELLYSSGIRVSEAAQLRRREIDFNRRVLRVYGKGGKERVVPFNTHAALAIQDYWKRLPEDISREFAFLNRFSQPITPRGIRKALQGLAREQGMEKPVSPHTFRHSFASHFLSGGAELRVVQEALGHASLSTTQIYTHINWEKMKSAYQAAHPRSGKKSDS